jgi:hypothetical protein
MWYLSYLSGLGRSGPTFRDTLSLYHSTLPSRHPLLTGNQLPFSKASFIFRTCEMGGQSRSTHFRALFVSALQAYEKQTGITLAEHPLAVQLLSCSSVESITTFLQDQIPASNDLGGCHRIMTSINSTVSILSTLSTATAFDWAIGLVSQKALMALSSSLMVFYRHSPLKMHCMLVSLSYLLCVPFFISYARILVKYWCVRWGENPATVLLWT